MKLGVLTVLASLVLMSGCMQTCRTLPIAWQPGETAVGVAGERPSLIASRPDQRWAVFAQGSSLWMVVGGGAGERIDAFLGASDRALGVAREGRVELVSIADSAQVIALDGMLERPEDAALLPDGRLLWVRAGRHEAELIDTQTDARRTFAVAGPVRRAAIDPTGTWFKVEEEADEVRYESEYTARRRTFFELASDRSVVVDHYAYEARAWGIVSPDQIHMPDGRSLALDDHCIVDYVGIETSMVIGRCETRLPGERGTTTYGPPMVWRVGEARPVVLDDVVMATFAEIDRCLLSLQHVRAALRSGLWHRVRARPPAEVRVRGFNTLRWSETDHAWREVEPEPTHTLPYGVLAWSEDGSALVMRTTRREGGICFGQGEPTRTQLLFTHIDR